MNELNYNPDNLLDIVKERLHFRSDAALCRALKVAPPVLSKIRHRRVPVGSSLLIRLHEVSECSIKDLRALMGDKRPRFESIVI